jgi:hypothetical protein
MVYNEQGSTYCSVAAIVALFIKLLTTGNIAGKIASNDWL